MSTLGLLFSIVAIGIAVSNELFMRLVKSSSLGIISFMMPVVVLVSNIFFILATTAFNTFLAALFTKFAISWLRLGMVLIWLFSELMRARRFINMKTFFIVSVYSASVLTYSLSSIKFERVMGFWERVYIYGPYYFLDHILLSVLQIATIYSLLRTSIEILRRTKTPRKRKIVKFYYLGVNIVVIFVSVAWFVLVYELKMFFLFSTILSVGSAVLPLIWFIVFRRAWFIFYVGLTRLLGIFIVDLKRSQTIFTYSEIPIDAQNFSRLMVSIIQRFKGYLSLNVRTIFLESGVLVLSNYEWILIGGLFTVYDPICQHIISFLGYKVYLELASYSEESLKNSDIKKLILELLDPFLP